jgi:hypothetical protein
MPDYEKLYKIVFNGLTDAVECMENGGCERAKEMLIRAQQTAEEYFMQSGEEDSGTAAHLYVIPHDIF